MSSSSEIAVLLREAYGLQGELTALGGENDNYRVDVAGGRRFVLKVAANEITTELVEAEALAVETLHTARLGLALPRVVPTREGASSCQLESPGESPRRVRLIEFVDGECLGDAGEPTTELAHEFGRALARIDGALATADDPAIHRTHRWDLARAGQHRARIALVPDAGRRELLERAFHLHAASAAPRLAELPHSWIHGDANDENVLVHGGRVSGLLDFGDTLYNPTVCELAIALAYALFGSSSPLELGAEIVAGYHGKRPLSLPELEVLFPLVCGRLAVTVTVCAERRCIDPGHPSWFVSEARALALLERLMTFDPVEAGRRLAARTQLDPFPPTGAPLEALIEKRDRHISRALSLAYDEPLKIVRGRGQYLFDDRGRPFLDMVNNVCHVGHCHPRVVEAGQAQMARLNTNTRYVYDGLTDYAERLCATLPDGLETCFFVNSGSEANELALRLAMTHTQHRDFLVVDGAYHGHTAGLIAISPYKFMGSGGAGRSEPWVHVVPIADGYRGAHKGQGLDAGHAYADEVGRVIAAAEGPIAGFISESVLSCGGQVVPPEGYFERAYQYVREAGGLCIADEVQVGFGRVGTHFWAFERQDIVPDIVVMGKPIGNGHPMAAVVTTAEVAGSFANGMEFFATFGGNPVSCAIGLAVLDVIEDEGLQQRALELGRRLREGLTALMPVHPIIGEVRGAGLFVGVELVRDRQTLEPAAAEAEVLVQRMKARGVLLSTDGPLHNVIKIKPPMVLSADDVDMTVRLFADELRAMQDQGDPA